MSSGPVLFKPGTHTLGQLRHEEHATDNDGNLLAFGQSIPEDAEAEERLSDGGHEDHADADHGHHPHDAVAACSSASQRRGWASRPTVAAADLRPGEASAHSMRVVHSSQPNRDAHARVGLAMRLVTGEAGQGRRDRVTLLCGDRAHVGGFELEEHVPEEEFGARELREWDLSMAREKEMYFAGRNGDTVGYK
eukprot:905139-Rhodomonas_salina.4